MRRDPGRGAERWRALPGRKVGGQQPSANDEPARPAAAAYARGVNLPLTRAAAPLHCRHCQTPLSELARRRGLQVCDAAGCRHRSDLEQTAALQVQLGRLALAAAAAQLPHLPVPVTRVLWLQHSEPQLVPLSESRRQAHLAHLEAVAHESRSIDQQALAAHTAVEGLPQGEQLCAHCRGRCCQHGGPWHAFIDIHSLLSWQEQHPGATRAEAVQAYMQMLPAAHVHGACLYQTEQGCAMPRERRAAICNGFACPPLQEVQRAAQADPQVAVLALTLHRNEGQRAAVVHARGCEAVQLPPLP